MENPHYIPPANQQQQHGYPPVNPYPNQPYDQPPMYQPPVITQQPGLPSQEMFLQPTTVTQQPGVFVQPAPGAVWMPLPPTMQGVPPGLEYLTLLEMIQVYQLKELLEILTNWETKNKYVLKNANGEQCYFAFEESDDCQRQSCGPQRGFVMHIVDNFKREVLTISRDFKCCGNCCCGCCSCECCLQECTVSTPSMGVLGTMKQKFGCCRVILDVMDSNGQPIFEIAGPDCCTLSGCGDKEFSIRTPNTEQVIGAITKKWGGILRETYTKADTFFVSFPQNLDVKLKGVLLGATFLIDFMQFEQPKNQNRHHHHHV
ncbi:unnamed protein product [Caenorhabditis brenneri]